MATFLPNPETEVCLAQEDLLCHDGYVVGDHNHNPKRSELVDQQSHDFLLLLRLFVWQHLRHCINMHSFTNFNVSIVRFRTAVIPR